MAGAIRETGKRILNFQLTWLLTIVVIYGSVLFKAMNHLDIPFLSGRNIFWVFVFLYAFNVCGIVLGTIQLYQKRAVRFLPAIPFIRTAALG